MDTIELPLELTKALDKAEKNNNRAIRAAGYGASDVGLRIAQDHLGALADYISERRVSDLGNNTVGQFLRAAEGLSSELMALVGLQDSIHSVATALPRTTLFDVLGKDLSAECWAAGLTRDEPKLAAQLTKRAKVRYGNVKQRRGSVRREAERRGYQQKEWTPELSVAAGAWLADCCVSALPELFFWAERRDEAGRVIDPQLSINPEALAHYEALVGECIARRPVHVPRLTPPQPWAGWQMANDDPRVSFRTTFLRTHHKDVAAACRAAIKDGTMQPALDAVNALQAVPYKINTTILGIIKECLKRKIDLESLPLYSDVPVPTLSKLWEDMDEDERKRFMMEKAEADKANLALAGDRIMLAEDMKTAEWLAEADRFYTPMNCDWRGRIYALCHFNFMRDDRVRALFQFAEGLPIGEEGMRWLMIHVANCGAFDKIDKAPMEDRIAWVSTRGAELREIAADPFSEKSLAIWTKADSPFLFLAAVIELIAALDTGPSYVTHMPTSYDGSCSGLQHLSCLTRDELTAGMVNLLPTDKPSDVYSIIGGDVQVRVEAEEENRELAELFLAHGITRKTAKRNVMTYSYSSKKHGMAGQQQIDLMDDLQKQVLRKKLKSHPFAPYHKGTQEKPGKAARFIAGHVYAAIEDRIKRPAMAMKYLQGVAKALAHECKPVRWTTPDGIPWINRYHPVVVNKVELWMHDRGVKKRTQVTVAVSEDKEVDKEKAANGIAPNVVHALDAAHLKLSVNAAVAAGIVSIATVHDSFGCLAPQAAQFNHIIRATMVRMYEDHDVLNEIDAQARHDLTQHNCDRLPPVPEYGAFNLKEIENAPYAFA